MDTRHSILSRWIKPWTKVSPLSRIPPNKYNLKKLMNYRESYVNIPTFGDFTVTQ